MVVETTQLDLDLLVTLTSFSALTRLRLTLTGVCIRTRPRLDLESDLGHGHLLLEELVVVLPDLTLLGVGPLGLGHAVCGHDEIAGQKHPRRLVLVALDERVHGQVHGHVQTRIDDLQTLLQRQVFLEHVPGLMLKKTDVVTQVVNGHELGIVE